MSDRLIRIVVLFVSLWLPLQGFAAPLMPYCQHAGSQPAEAMPCHGGQSGEANEAQQERGQPGQNCDGCGLCHMASTAAPVSRASVWSQVIQGADLPLYSNLYRSHIPEQPRRPPLALIS